MIYAQAAGRPIGITWFVLEPWQLPLLKEEIYDNIPSKQCTAFCNYCCNWPVAVTNRLKSDIEHEHVAYTLLMRGYTPILHTPLHSTIMRTRWHGTPLGDTPLHSTTWWHASPLDYTVRWHTSPLGDMPLHSTNPLLSTKLVPATRMNTPPPDDFGLTYSLLNFGTIHPS